MPGFHETFAHACVDVGADAFMGHGLHLLRDIEIYDGTPIFYGLGDLIMQNETVTRLPTEIYERYDLDRDATPADLFDTRVFDEDNERIGFLADQGFWETVVPVCEYENSSLDRIELYPVELGFDAPRGQRGRPVLARGEDATHILEGVADLSTPYNTASLSRTVEALSRCEYKRVNRNQDVDHRPQDRERARSDHRSRSVSIEFDGPSRRSAYPFRESVRHDRPASL